MEENVLIINEYKEGIDTLIEGNKNADVTIVFVHGFGANKDEGSKYFVDVAEALKDRYRIVRFDFTGYGSSAGKDEEVNYKKQAKDLDTVLKYVKKRFSGRIIIFAHSMGCLVTSMLNPDGIEKAVFTSIPNYNTKYLSAFFQEWIGRKPEGLLIQKA